MDSWIHPALFFFLGALLLPLFKGKAKKGFILLVPVLRDRRRGHGQVRHRTGRTSSSASTGSSAGWTS